MAKLEKSKLFEFWWQLDRRKLTRREAVDKCFEYFVSSTDLETSSLTNDNEDALKKSLDFTLKYYDKQYLAGSQKKSFVLKKISKLPHWDTKLQANSSNSLEDIEFFDIFVFLHQFFTETGKNGINAPESSILG